MGDRTITPFWKQKASFYAFIWLLIIAPSHFSSVYSQNHTFAWENSYGDAQEQEATSIVHDHLNDVVIAGGIFEGNIVLGDTNFTSSGVENIWLTKADANGNIVWALNAPSATDDEIKDIAVDDFGNIYITGHYTGSTIFTGVLGNTYTLTSQGAEDIFLVKFNSSGEIQWAETYGGSGQDLGEGLTTLSGNDNVFITGGFSGSATFQSGPPLNSSGGLDAFVMAVNRNTALKLWIRQGACAEDAVGTAITVDGSGVYATGDYYGNSPLTFDGFGSGLTNIGVGGVNMYIVKYAVNGFSTWQRYAGNGTGIVNSNGVSVSGGTRVYVTGAFDGTTSFSTTSFFEFVTSYGQLDAFLVGYDRNTGQVLDLDGYGGPGNDIGTSLSLSTSNEVFLTATYDDTMFVGTDTLVPTGTDAMIASFSQTGSVFNWSLPITGVGDQNTQGISGPVGDIYVAGSMSDVSEFIPFTSNFAGQEDAFFAKVGCPNRLSSSLMDTLAGPDTSVCLSNTLTLSADSLNPFAGQWNLLSGSGTISNSSAPDAILTPTGTGNIELEWVLTSGTCILRDTVEIMVPATFTPEAGPDTTICDTFYTMMATDPTPNTGTWTLVSGAGNIGNINQFNTAVNALGYGVNVFQWEVDDGSCTLSDNVIITVNPPLTASTSNDTIICSPNFVLAGNDPTPNSGMWIQHSGLPAVINNPAQYNSPVTLGPGQSVFTWEVTDGTCTVHDSFKVDYVVPIPANAGPDTSICGTAYIMQAGTPNPAVGSWTNISGTGSATSLTDPNSPVIGLTPGTSSEFEWAVTTSSVCTELDTITIQSFAAIPANAGPDDSLCLGSGYNLQGNDPSPGTGLWTVVSGTAVITTPTQYNSPVTLSSAGTDTLVWQTTNGPCISSDTVVITIVSPPVSNAGGNVAVCGDTVTLAGNDPSPDTGVWAVVSGAGTFSNTGDFNAFVSNLNNGINEFSWTVSNGTCSVSDSVIIVSDAPIVADAGMDNSICSTAVTITGNIVMFSSGGWEVTSGGGGGTLVTPSLPTTDVTNLTTGTNEFAWILLRGACSDTDTVTITVFDPPTVSNAGLDDSLCMDTLTTLAGNTPTTGTGTWSLVGGGGPGNIVSPSNPNSDVNALQPGTASFEWAISNGVCPVSRDTVDITVILEIPSNAGPDQAICDTFATTLAGNPVGTGTGTWSGPGGVIFANPNDPVTDVSGLSGGSNELVWTIVNGPCTTTDTVDIVVTVFSSTVNAGSNEFICDTQSVTLNAANPAPGTGVWSVISGTPPTFSSTTDPGATISNTDFGVTNLQWTVTEGSCMYSDTVTIDITNPPPPADAGPNQSICDTNATTMAGSPIVSGAGIWTIAQGFGTFTAPNSPTTDVTGIPQGLNRYIWTISSGACTTRDTVSVLMTVPSITPNAGNDTSFCGLQTVQLSGNDPTPAKGAWTLGGSGSVTFVDDSLFNTSSSGYSLGTNELVWTIFEGACISSDSVNINFTAPPSSADAGPDEFLCDTLSTTLAGSDTTGVIGNWTVATGTGIFTNPGDSNTVVSGLSPGLNQFIWTTTVGACTSSDIVDISVTIPSILPDAGPDTSVCGLQTITLAANDPDTLTGTWSSANPGPIFSNVNDSSAQVSNLMIGPNPLIWTIDEGNCSHADTVIIDITSPPTAANAGPDQALCDTLATTMVGSVPSSGNGNWSIQSGSGVFANPGDPASSVSGLSSGLNQFIWTITDGPCITDDTVDIVVTIGTVTADAGPDQDLCGFQTVTMDANDPSGGTGIWTPLIGNPTVTPPTDSNATVTGLQLGTNPFEWTITEGACITSDTVNINITQLPPAPYAGPDQQLCDTFSTNLDGSDPQWATGTWSILSGTGTVANPNDSTTTVNGLAAGNNLICWTTTNGNCELIDTMEVFITVPSVLPDAGPDQSICQGDTVFISGNSPPANGSASWYLPNGQGTIDSLTALNTYVHHLPVGLEPVVWMFTENVCVRTDTAFITVLPIPVPDAGQDQSICDTTITTLQGLTQGNGVGTWNIINGSGSLSNPADSNAVLSGLTIGTTSLAWTVDNGSCDATDTVDITVLDPPSMADAGPDQSICDMGTSTLSAQIPAIGAGVWTSLGTAVVDSITDPNSPISGLQPGLNAFVWTVSLNLCQDRNDTVVLDVTLMPAVEAGPNYNICEGDSVTLNGAPFQGFGLWSDLAGNAGFSHPDSNITEVSNLTTGINGFILTVIDGPCQVDDTAFVQVDQLPTIPDAGEDRDVPNNYTTMEGNTPLVGVGIWTTALGTGVATNPDLPMSEVTDLTLGENILVWTISNGTCPSNSDSVRIQVLDLLVPTGFSPNGDGTNDTWVIRGGQNFGTVRVQVFNRWGNQVFHSTDYNNDWRGQSDNGADLADDTYYYILNLGDGTESNGYVVIKR